MGLHFHVKFESDATYTEITELVKFDSVKFSTSLCNDKFKFSQDTVKAQTIYDKTTNDKFFSATKYLPCYVTYDLQDEQMYGYSGRNNYGFLSPGRIFTGAIYPNTKETLRDYPTEGVSFEIVDNAYTIDKDCEAFSYPQLLSHTWKVFDPSDKTWSLIHQLLYKAGVDDSMISPVGSITKIVEHISKEAEEDTYLKIINELLYEHHHVAYFDGNGIFCIYDWAHANIVIDDIITEADILDAGGVERERNIIDYDGYKAIYKSLSTKERALVYREDIDEDGKLLLEGGYFPVDGAIKDIYQSFTNKYLSEDAKILNTFNHVLETTKDNGIVIQSELYESTQAKVLLKNLLTEDQRLFQLDIRADVIYEDGEEEFTVPSTAKKLDKDITFNYIFNELDAKEFANSLYNNTIKNGSYIYTFLSTNNYSIGRKYNIITRDYDKNVLVIGKEWDDYTRAYKYNCIEVAQRVIQIGRIKSFRMSSTQANVFSTAQLRLMKRSETVPNAYSGGKVSYTFSTGAISFENGNNDGWALTPLTSDGAVYVIYASANSQALTDEILANEWTAPVMLLEEAVAGKDGANVQTIFIFNTSPSIPSLPSVEATHNFKTGLISGLNNQWENQKDIVGGNKIWVSTATAFSYSLTDAIPASEWSEPVVWKQKGDTGAKGEDAYQIQIYSSDGNAFRVGKANTTLTAYVFQGADDITDTIDSSLFRWIRKSQDTALADDIWNTSSKAVGNKQVFITPEDTIGRTVFSCEVDI